MRKTHRLLPKALAVMLGVSAAIAPQAAMANEGAVSNPELTYLVRDENGAWAQDWTTDSKAALGSDANITGLKIRLTTEEADEAYDVFYRARTEQGTMLEWQREGEELASDNHTVLHDVQYAITDAGGKAPFVDDVDTVSSAPNSTEDDTALSAQNVTWIRLAGDNRYSTASAIVKESFAKSDWAVLASGKDFPDALAACGLAGVRDCPIILTTGDKLSPEAETQLKELKVKHAYVMGGAAAIVPEVDVKLKDLGIEPVRVFGENRSLTSVKALDTLKAASSTSHDIIIASGSSFADALSIGPWAFANKVPIVLTKSDGTLAPETVAAIKGYADINHAIIVGGESAVKASVKDQLGSGYVVDRLQGKNRYETSRAIAEWEISKGFTLATPAVASGKNFPDALAGGVLCGKNKAPLLIAADARSTTMEMLRDHKAEVTGGYILGGKGAVDFDDPLATPPEPEPDPVDPSNPMTVKAQQYYSATEWLILVDCTNNKLAVFKGSQNKWFLQDQWTVSTGQWETPTITGEFTVGDRGYAFGDDHHTCYYWTQIYGGYLFHSVLYYPGTFEVRDGRLGEHCSMGCVRNPIEKAKWIYDNIPYGSKIVTYYL